MKPSPISSVRASAVSPSNRTRASLPLVVSTRAVSGVDVSITIRVKDGYERNRSSSSVTGGDAGARGAVVGGDAAATGCSRGVTWAMNVAGTSQTPRRTRTGASSIIGSPSTTMRAQLRVTVMTWPAGRREA
jgi:hypothetical protein